LRSTYRTLGAYPSQVLAQRVDSLGAPSRSLNVERSDAGTTSVADSVDHRDCRQIILEVRLHIPSPDATAPSRQRWRYFSASTGRLQPVLAIVK
jgi:hypothetical protein